MFVVVENWGAGVNRPSQRCASQGGVVVAEQKTAGSAFSFSQSYLQGDAVAGSAPTVGAVNNFGDMSSTAGGTVGSLAGSVTSSHGFSGVAAGGANTSATSQFVTEVTIR